MTGSSTDPKPGGGFDVSGWLQLVDEVQRLGFDTARGVASRFAAMADGAFANQSVGPPRQVDTMVGAWQDMMGRVATPEMQDKIFDAIESMTKAAIDVCVTAWDAIVETMPAGTMPGFGGPAGTGDGHRIRLGSTNPGGTVTGDVYVHVGNGVDAPKVPLKCVGLHSATGEVIPERAVTLEPNAIVDPRPNETYPVQVTVTVPDDTPAGTYQGVILALVEPASVVKLRLEVIQA